MYKKKIIHHLKECFPSNCYSNFVPESPVYIYIYLFIDLFIDLFVCLFIYERNKHNFLNNYIGI